MSARDVVITGLGLVSSLGEGAERHWQALSAPGAAPVLDAERFDPYTIHPLPEIDWGLQIAKRGDQRQMETWQRLGTYAAGVALDDAGAKDEALLATMDMVVAAGGGERDVNVDQAILDAARTRNDRDLLLNEKLTTELRPTLFLAQLSNLLAGNISIVHKVTGSSRTFMGEEGAGISAIETAAARIRSGQSSHVLVGGAFQTEHPDMLLGYELGGFLHRKRWKPVWQRAANDGGGVISGSGAAFLVLESREHAEARGHKPYAAIKAVASGRARRDEGNLPEAVSGLLRVLGAPDEPLMAISGASGAHSATGAERAALASAGDYAVRGFSTLTGHLKEAQFPFAIALAALAIRHGAHYPAFDAENETAAEGAPRSVVATTIGYRRFEGAALVVAA
ncbi:beta-ketoacyl-ACP synthase [Mesorhizobium microcysteis]|jgi:3-oxoacyl-[acyl-carrier-protein] synthase II|uniref:Beta-ketoacyl-ACP synthase n=1 Tax=Neoaquamicrobium microcysteis TaxID=2682781 RepID=A0A5D4GVQ4_9HYPH|nr:beta-ketoacyl-ACP synthase [Mesorhizobium microcysteis]TYR32457.1 beta-ketoacyl-ACP synthase [Mesorhizobium microcysteis]